MSQPKLRGAVLRRARAAIVLSAVAAACVALPAAPAAADDKSEDFETFDVGSDPMGQAGWATQDVGGYNAANLDMEIANPSGVWGTALGTRALRFSNGVTTGGFGNQLQTPSLANEAGESGALNIGLSGGTRQSRMQASFDLASVTQAYQPGMSFSISMDRGDGARQTWLRVFDQVDGLAVEVATFESSVGNFVTYPIASGLPFDQVLHIDMTLDMVDGPNNDVFTIQVGGECGSFSTSGSWEDYHRLFDGPVTVDSLLFRLAGTAQPANQGKGYYFDNLAESTSTVAPMPPIGTPGAPAKPTGSLALNGLTTVTAPAVTGTNACEPVTSYRATATPLDGGTPLVFTSPTPNFSFPTPFSGAFTLTMSAINASGAGPESERAVFAIDPVFADDDELAATGADVTVQSAVAAGLVAIGWAMVGWRRRAAGAYTARID